MKRATVFAVSLALVLGPMLAMSADGLAGEKEVGAVLTGTIYCVDISGKLQTKAGVCPAEHIGHIIITDDGRAVMLGGGEKVDKLIRSLAFPAGTKVTVRGKLSEELSAIELEEIALDAGGA